MAEAIFLAMGTRQGTFRRGEEVKMAGVQRASKWRIASGHADKCPLNSVLHISDHFG